MSRFPNIFLVQQIRHLHWVSCRKILQCNIKSSEVLVPAILVHFTKVIMSARCTRLKLRQEVAELEADIRDDPAHEDRHASNTVESSDCDDILPMHLLIPMQDYALRWFEQEIGIAHKHRTVLH